MAEAECIHGLHAVRAALKHDASSVLEAWVEKGRRDARMDSLREELESHGVRIQSVDKRELDKRCGGAAHQGVVIRCRSDAPRFEGDLDGLLASLDVPPFLLVLDQVQDPHNLGACLRTADAAGVHAVIVPKDRAAGLTPTVHKVSSGAARSVPFFQVTNLARTLAMLKQQGVWLVGAAGEAEGSIYDLELDGPLAVVMGAEGEGLRRLTSEACDYLAHIPMAGSVESLNVSVATGIMLFEAVRQRR